MVKKLNRYNPNYSYKKNTLKIDMRKKEYPILEKTNNALLFPECPKDNIDMEQFK